MRAYVAIPEEVQVAPYGAFPGFEMIRVRISDLRSSNHGTSNEPMSVLS